MSSLPEMFDPYATMRRHSVGVSPAPRGYYIVRQLLIVGAVAGGLVALYRNDVYRDLARRVGQEQRYLSAEKFLVGSPGWGTPRSMEPVLAGVKEAPPETEPEAKTDDPVELAAKAQPRAPAQPTAAPAAPAPAAQAPVTTAGGLVPVPLAALAPTPSDPLRPVSLDSLPVAGGHAGKTISLDAPAAAPAPAPAAASRPAAGGNAKAIKVSLDDAPRSAPAKAPAPAKPAPPPEPQKPKATEARANDNPLTAAIRGAVRARPPKDTIPE